MKFLFGLLSGTFPGALSWVLRFVKLELASLYVEAVDRSRRLFILALLGVLVLLLCLSGFTLIHVALFYYLPWSIQDKAILLLVLGLVYFWVPLILIILAASRKAWMKASGATEFCDKALKDHHRH
jgi:hypothetical protein